MAHNMEAPRWSQDELDTLRKLWAEDLLCREIGERMGRTKAAIAGKARTLGLPMKVRANKVRSKVVRTAIMRTDYIARDEWDWKLREPWVKYAARRKAERALRSAGTGA